MKKFLLVTLVSLSALFVKAGPVPTLERKTYGLHLFFNETEYVDVLTLEKSATGALKGEMIVPMDFTGPLLDLKIDELKIGFDLFVPKNNSRPKDMIFHYEGQFFDAAHTQFIGFVTIKNQPGFVAAFTGFLRD